MDARDRYHCTGLGDMSTYLLISRHGVAQLPLQPNLILQQQPSYTSPKRAEPTTPNGGSYSRQMLTACKSSFLGLRRNPCLGLAAIDLEDRPA
jgi:hypothetical protein